MKFHLALLLVCFYALVRGDNGIQVGKQWKEIQNEESAGLNLGGIHTRINPKTGLFEARLLDCKEEPDENSGALSFVSYLQPHGQFSYTMAYMDGKVIIQRAIISNTTLTEQQIKIAKQMIRVEKYHDNLTPNNDGQYLVTFQPDHQLDQAIEEMNAVVELKVETHVHEENCCHGNEAEDLPQPESQTGLCNLKLTELEWYLVELLIISSFVLSIVFMYKFILIFCTMKSLIEARTEYFKNKTPELKKLNNDHAFPIIIEEKTPKSV